jgi:hypothetical protein
MQLRNGILNTYKGIEDSGSVTITGSLSVSDSITGSNALFTGTITAQTLVVQVITSSISYITGSTRFGSRLTDTHTFTGSVNISSSLTVVGDLYATASYAISASWAPDSTFPYTGSARITGSLAITGSMGISGSTRIETIASSGTSYLDVFNGSNSIFRLTNRSPYSDLRLADGGSGGPVLIGTNGQQGWNETGTGTVIIHSSTGTLGSHAGTHNNSVLIGWNGAAITYNSANTIRIGNINSLQNIGDSAIGIGVDNWGMLVKGDGTVNQIRLGGVSLMSGVTGSTTIGVGLTTTLSNVVMLGLSSQTTMIGQGTATGSGAILQIDSTSKGFLLSRMSAAQKIAISSPARGLQVYDTGSATEGIWYYDSGSIKNWTRLLNDSGSQILSGSMTSTQGFTGSLFGTASWAINSTNPISRAGTTNLYSTQPLAGIPTATNSNVIFFGESAGSGSDFAESSVFLGSSAGRDLGLSIQAGNNFLGSQSGRYANKVNDSNFFGRFSGYSAINSQDSNFFGEYSGYYAYSASYSTLIGFQVGRNANLTNGIGPNNIIVGTNITLEDNRRDSINLGGLIFATGSYSSVGSDTFSGSANGRVGINQPLPLFNLDVSGSGRYTNNLQVTGSLIAPNITGSLFGTASQATALQNTGSNGFVSNMSDTYTGTAKITDIVTLSSAEYAAIGSPLTSTLYIII